MFDPSDVNKVNIKGSSVQPKLRLAGCICGIYHNLKLPEQVRYTFGKKINNFAYPSIKPMLLVLTGIISSKKF